MPDSKSAAEPTKQAGQPAASKPEPAESPRGGNSGQDSDPTKGLADALQAQHKARTEVPGHPGIDARLDNRSGAARPPLEEWPAKPQQIDGPDVAHQLEHTRATLKNLEENVGPVKGAFSIGSHGLSQDEELREGRPVQGPDEG
jgi:hypothetical protein